MASDQYPAPLTPADCPDLAAMRVEYRQRSLSEAEVNPDPIRQFIIWLEEAIAAGALEPTAMALATCSPDGMPSVRMVLLKGVDAGGLVFFTNYQSRKGRELETRPAAALAFYWPELERQVRVEGSVARVTPAESDAYFASRPSESRIGAAVSPQSQPIPSRDFLEQRVRDLAREYPNGNIPRPAEWGGYRLTPHRIEFWQGRPSRLHDRIEYQSLAPAKWQIRRLAP